MSLKQTNILAIYKASFSNAASNWRAIIIVYFFNLFLAFLAIGPLSNILKKAFSNTTLESQLLEGFNYSIIGDFIREYNLGVSLSFYSLLSFAFLYFLWAVFYQGGWMALMKNNSSNKLLTQFWAGGAYYFFRNLRLSLYISAFIFFMLFGLFLIFSQDGLNPLHVYSELPYITKFWTLLFLLFVICFLVSIFRDLAKVYIAKIDKSQIARSNLIALNKTRKLKSLLLAVINGIVFLLFGLLFYSLQKFIAGYIWPSIILSQLFLLFRISYKFIKLNSFWKLEEGELV